MSQFCSKELGLVSPEDRIIPDQPVVSLQQHNLESSTFSEIHREIECGTRKK